MKKRIIAILLSVSVFCFSLTFGHRASAAATGTIVAIASIGTVAFSIFTLITSGEAERIAEDVYDWIEYTAKPGMDVAFTGDGSWLATGYNEIFQTVKSLFDNGELEIVDGQVVLTYAQYYDLYSQVLRLTAKPDVDFTTELPYQFYSADLSLPIFASDLPLIKSLYEDDSGQSFAPVYFTDNMIIFSEYYWQFSFDTSGHQGHYAVSLSYFSDYHRGYLPECYLFGINHTYDAKIYDFLTDYKYTLFMPSLSSFTISHSEYPNFDPLQYNMTFSNCYVFSNGTLTYTPLSEIDISGMSSGLITSGDYPDFLTSLKGFSNNSSTSSDSLDDLTDTLPVDYNPTLSFPVDPDLSRPIANQVIVGNVPGVANLPLSNYQASVNTEIDVPSIINSKFPFCIPFDFIRFLGLLCADPVAPVFRIPISTHPDNLEQWEGNQTIGEYLNPENPIFEIDEEIVIDLSVIPLVQPICYTCFIVGFIFLLLHITPKMIQH